MRSAIVLCLITGAAGSDANCNVGLTIKGAQEIDGDWIAEDLENGQAIGFMRKQDVPKGTYGATLQHGCFYCNDTDKQHASHTWVVRTVDNHLHAHLVATCTKGCPDGKTWPLSWRKQTEWLITSSKKTVTAPLACCARKPQACDACDSKKCESHDSFSSCLAASTLGGCCTAAGWLDEGRCKCQETALECDHSDTDKLVV